MNRKLIRNFKSIIAPSTLVYNLQTTEPHTFFPNSMDMGISFVDLSDGSNVQKIKFSITAPAWRLAKSGIFIEGKCMNASCRAFQQQVIIKIGL